MIINNFSLFRLFILAFVLLQGCGNKEIEPVIEIRLAKLENYVVDGLTQEWNEISKSRLWANPLGGYPEPEDLESHIKVSWSSSSINFLVEVHDQSNVIDTVNPWNGDAIEIFLSPYRGSDNILHASIVPLEGEDFYRYKETFGNTSSGIFNGEIKSVSRIEGRKRTTEIEIGLNCKAYSNQLCNSIALQVYVDDADQERSEKNQLTFYPLGQSYNFSSSMFESKFSIEESDSFTGASRFVITDNQKLNLYVFGASKGDQIGIYQNGKIAKSYTSISFADYLPDTIDLSDLNFNLENDSVFITINDKILYLHELFLAPRLYKTISEKRFERDIRHFVFSDHQQSPPENAALFIGSSSIVRWETLHKDFPELTIIKRGFGGSTSPEALMYIEQIALPYKPSKIFYYEGDNDITMGISPEEIRNNVSLFINKIHAALPHTEFYIISPKPSISRMHLWKKYQETHSLLIALADSLENVKFVDVSTPMFDENGKLKASLFVGDGIHMNEGGYAIWTKTIREALKE